MPDYNDSDFDQGQEEQHVPHGAMMAHATGGGHDEEHEGAPEWLISFADMVMLIMGFFVILFALNMTPPAKAGAEGDSDGEGGAMVHFDRWAEFVWNTRAAFGNPIDLDTTDPELRKVVDWYYSNGPGRALDEGEPGDKEEIHSPRDTGEHSLMIDLKFAHDSEHLTDEGMERIQRLARQVRGLPMIIEVHGHASRGEAGNDTEAGLELSFERAMAVSRALAADGVNWRRIEIVAAGDNEPFTDHPSNSIEDAPNRRVEIRVTNRHAVDPVRTEPVDTP